MRARANAARRVVLRDYVVGADHGMRIVQICLATRAFAVHTAQNHVHSARLTQSTTTLAHRALAEPTTRAAITRP
jgi:hypothetical protein